MRQQDDLTASLPELCRAAALNYEQGELWAAYWLIRRALAIAEQPRERAIAELMAAELAATGRA